VPLSISDPSGCGARKPSMEIKRALDMVEQIPFGYLRPACGRVARCCRRAPLGRGLQLPRTPVSVSPGQPRVTIALENTPGGNGHSGKPETFSGEERGSRA